MKKVVALLQHVTERPHTWMHVKERIYMILFPFTLMNVFWIALWVAHTVLVANIRVRPPGLAYLSVPLFSPENRCNVSHLHKGT